MISSDVRQLAAPILISSRNDACEAPSYRLASRIQAHGLFLAAEPTSLRIVRLSSNAGSYLGLSNDLLLGSTIPALLAPGSAAQVRDAVESFQDGRETRDRLSLVLNITGPWRFSAAAFLYRSDGLICIEIEPPPYSAGPEMTAVLSSRFFDMVDSVARTAVRSDQLASLVCEAIQKITGFDRIYFCRFDSVGHGHVSGESNNGVLTSLMDHHFPATDVPQAARQIMTVNRFRLIPDVSAPDVPIIGAQDTPLDLTFSSYRAIAESHLQYLRNMQVGASLSFSVVANGDGRLEALFGGHHHAARHVSFRQMMAGCHLVELFKARFDSLKIAEDQVDLQQGTRALHDLAARFLQAGCDLGGFIDDNHAAFCDLMDADDVVCRIEQQDHLGRKLPSRQASRLLDYLAQKIAGGTELFQSDCLLADSIELGALLPAAAGALAVSLDLSGSTIIAWLRRETVVDQTWSGNPHQAIQVDDRGSVGPRSSFLAYIQETTGTCRAWPSTAGELAIKFRYAFSQALARYYETGMREAAEQASELKSEFLSNVTHELRSPMHAIIGFTRILAEEDSDLPPAKRKRFLDTILQSSQRLLHLIDDLLNLSRLQAGKQTFHLRPGDILPVVERAVAAIEALARIKRIEITIRNDCRSGAVFVDAASMEQVFINLLANALRFSPAGSHVLVTLDTHDQPSSVLIEVSDQGVGIPAAELDLVFDKFAQSSRTKSGGGGTGLGLAICREIVNANHGRIWASNNAAGGTSLFVELPQETNSSDEPQS